MTTPMISRRGFWQAFAVGYGMWLFIDWYDCFFLDWVLFANMKAVRNAGERAAPRYGQPIRPVFSIR